MEYRLSSNFWLALYSVYVGKQTSMLPIIDLSGPWLTPLVASIHLGVPYFYFEYMPTCSVSFKESSFKVIMTLIGSNCVIEVITQFSNHLDEFITFAKSLNIQHMLLFYF